ncbi:MarR family winged helix-turn-helix transcriptional regulator [Brevibacillus agri]|uniref:MarR family winged helix-turn-helix transcriptional regulator n=2 Tax=Bacteria TaxID=2 RepID=UPI003D7654D4
MPDAQKNQQDHTPDHSLPKLGVKPYADLLAKTAASETNQHTAYMGLLMLWLSDHVLDVMDQELAPYDITESKLDLLLLLTLHDGKELITPSAIAERLGIRRASATALLDWLEKRNWIVREQNSADRRRVHVKITAEGRALVEKVLPAYWSVCSSLFHELEPEELHVLENVLVKLNRTMENRLGVGR